MIKYALTKQENFGFQFSLDKKKSYRASLSELQFMVNQSCSIPQESGVDFQGFVCKSCPNPLYIGAISNIQ